MASVSNFEDGALAKALVVISASLEKRGIPFAFCGDVAYRIYNKTANNPRKIDVLLLFPYSDILQLKKSIAQSDVDRFIHNMPNSLSKLKYKDPDLEIIFTSPAAHAHPSAHLSIIDGIPVVPYSYIILQTILLWSSPPNSPALMQRIAPGVILQMMRVFRERAYAHDPSFWLEIPAPACEECVQRFAAVYPWYNKEWVMLGFLKDGYSIPQAYKVLRTTPGPPSSSAVDTTMPPQKSQDTAAPAAQSAGTPSQAGASTSKQKRRKRSERGDRLSRLDIQILAARTTVEVLQGQGFSCAIFGSMACKLYGNKRAPNDVDILVLPPPSRASITQEELKALIALHSPSRYHFRRVRPRDSKASYTVFFFLPEPLPTDVARLKNRPSPNGSSKVDILLPGIMHLPALDPSLITWVPTPFGSRTTQNQVAHIHHLPLVPFPVLLLQKLQGWDDHRMALEQRYKKKTPIDERDLWWALNAGVDMWLRRIGKGRAGISDVWRDGAMFTDEFQALTKERVKLFCDLCPSLTSAWVDLGFEV